MHLTVLLTDVIGVVTISLVSLLSLLGLLCVYRSICSEFWIRRRGFLQLSYFNGPWLTRVTLISVSIWWGLGEIARLTFLNGRGLLFPNKPWRERVCKFYIISNLGFSEPSMFLMLAFLLSAALQRSELGTLSRRWNRKTIGLVLILTLPALIWELALVFISPRFNEKISKYFTSTYSYSESGGGDVICTYPLLSTIFLGGFYVILMCYVTCVATRILSLVINKGLRQRIYILMFSVVTLLPLRVLLLGLSVLPRPGNTVYEAVVFLSFLLLLCCCTIGVVMLVYFPVADTLALRDPEQVEMEGLPLNDHY